MAVRQNISKGLEIRLNKKVEFLRTNDKLTRMKNSKAFCLHSQSQK